MTPAASWSPADFHAAFDRCRSLWERSAPQLTISGWADMLDGLDEGAVGQVPMRPLVEPTGLTAGAEPSCAVSRAAPPAPPNAGGSAPFNRNGFGHALHDEDKRGRTREGA